MKNEIILDNVKFWLDQDIIHAKFNSKVNKRFIEIEIEDILIEVIKALSNGKYRPILIDLSEVSKLNTIRMYKILSHSWEIKSIILSKSYIVKSIDLKLFLELFKFGSASIVDSKISTDYKSTIKFCNESYAQFNASY